MQNEFKMKSQTDFTYVHKKLYSQASEMNLCRVQLQMQRQQNLFLFLFSRERKNVN
jgi:hypothetical protein